MSEKTPAVYLAVRGFDYPGVRVEAGETCTDLLRRGAITPKAKG